ncbi:hypothetical protein M405DRAFT_884839 [Rhizopogon salebrosus TDB-379]|nr:hypothetical protein M405DRAFT_884839 [Rhizopogon salebrosus TDB-379]
MSEQISPDARVDVEILEHLLSLPPMTDDYLTGTESGRAFITQELDSIYVGFIGQYLTPDITTYTALYDLLASLIIFGLHTAEHRKQILDTLELAFVVFEKFVSVALKLERLRDPSGYYPTESCIRANLTCLIDWCLASPECSIDISPKLQKLKLIIEQRGTEAMASLASETEWLADLWGTEFKAWDETWLSEDISDAALDIVAMGLSAAPSSNEVSSHLPATTAKLTRTHSVILDAKQQPARSTRPLTASQSLNVIPTLDSRPKKGIPGRGVSISRTKSLSTILPPEAQHRVMTALDTVTEVEK